MRLKLISNLSDKLATSILGILLIILIGFPSRSVAEKTYDFKFRQMSLRKAIQSLADLEGKSVMFIPGVADVPVEVSLKRVTPAFALRMMLESYGFVAVSKERTYHIMTKAERGPSSSPPVVLKMKNVLAEEIEGNVKALLMGSGDVTVNKQMNALVINASDEAVERIRGAVEKLDQEVPQVFIQAKIVETTTEKSEGIIEDQPKKDASLMTGSKGEAQEGASSSLADTTESRETAGKPEEETPEKTSIDKQPQADVTRREQNIDGIDKVTESKKKP